MGDDNQNGQGSDNSDGNDSPKYVTTEQLNSAISGHMKRLEGRLGTTIGEAIATQMKAFAPKKDDDVPSDPQADPAPDGGKVDPQITSLKRQLSTLNNRLQKSEDARADEATQRRQLGLRSAVMKSLGESGLSGPHLKAASAVLYQDGKVHVTDDGSHLFKDQEGLDVPLADGVRDWVASDDARLFLPPKDVRGSGDRGSDKTKLPKLKSDAMSQAYADAKEGVGKFLLNQK